MEVARKKISKVDDSYFYYPAGDLGVMCSRKKTQFKIWAPDANKVEVLLFFDENNKSQYQRFTMEENIRGTWKLLIEKNLEGYYYLFRLYYQGNSYTTVDPYAKAVGTNSELGLIVNMKKTNPEGWEKDSRVKLDDPVDAIIYEMHVRDFSISGESGIKEKGKYLGLVEKGTTNSADCQTGLDHLIDLGITHIHLLPVFDFASVDDKEENDYNWGYDPYYYNVPEGSYATDPSDETRIIEFKKMVKKLHDNKIGVIMDVVYNHTYYTEKSAFQIIAPGYFYRTYLGSDFANGSGCGNEIATEKPMVRKFIIESLCYWAEEYHIDGFRFDLMGLIDKETMEQVEKALHRIDSNILLYGEPWFALPPQLDPDQQIRKGFQKGKKIAVFNDDFRGAIKGNNNGRCKGFVTGSKHCSQRIKQGIVGEIEYSSEISGFTEKPSETINYVSCHDDLSLWDKLSFLEEPGLEEKIKMDKMAQAVILTSQGIPFLHGGEEFLRTKYIDDNSYSSGDKVNQFKWHRKHIYYDVYKYYRGLIKLRKKHSAFRMRTAGQIKKHLQFISSPGNTVGFKLENHANNDPVKTIIVLYNPYFEWKHFELGEKRKLGIVVDDDRAGVRPFNVFMADNVNVPPISVMVLLEI